MSLHCSCEARLGGIEWIRNDYILVKHSIPLVVISGDYSLTKLFDCTLDTKFRY